MTVRLIGTPYGAPAFRALHAVLADHKRQDPLAPVTILAPSTIAGTVARRYLARSLRAGGTAGGCPSATGVAGIRVTTIVRLAEQLAAPTMGARRPATGPVVSAAWRAALDADSGGLFAPVKDHPATVTALLRAHRELRDLTAAQLDAVAGAGALPEAVVTLHRTVTGSLLMSWYDATDLLRAATEVVAAGRARLAEHGAFLLFLPQDLSNAESAVVRALAAAADLAVVAGRTGVERADDAIDRTLRRIGVDPALDKPRPPTGHRVRHASDSDEEVRLVVRDVVAALRDSPADRIAVLYTSADPYARLIHEQLAGAGIAVNGPGVQPVGERAIARGLVGVLRLVRDVGPDGRPEMPRAALFGALSGAPTCADLGSGSPTVSAATTGAGMPAVTAPGSAGRASDDRRPRVPAARWERLSRAAGVVTGDDWDTRLARFAAERRAAADLERSRETPSAGRIDAAERDAAGADELRRFAGRLRGRLAAATRLTDWAALSTWAVELFADLYGVSGGESESRLPADELYAAAAVEGVLTGLAALADVESTTSASALIEVVEQELATALPRVGRFGDGVFVGPLSAAVGLDLDRTFVVGLAEDAYPGRLHPDPLLSPSARAASGGALPAERDRLNAAHRHLLAAFASAPWVQASFPRGNLRRSTDRLPSRWLLWTLRRLTGRDDLAATDWESVPSAQIVEAPSFAAALLHGDASDVLATEQEWRVRAMSSGRQLDDPAIAAGLTTVRARQSTEFTRFDGNLCGAGDLPDFRAGIRTVSPTALESYADCPHGYFVRGMLGIEPIEQPEQTISISALDIGNLVHQAMDTLVTEFAGRLPGFGEPWRPEHRDRLAEIASDLARGYENSGATGHPRLWEHERRRILDDLAAMLADDDSYRREQDAEVVASELTFGRNGWPPVGVPVPGGTVLMVGSADKVDRTRDGVLLVTDIKTGGSQRYTVIGTDPVAAGTRLQLPVYAHAARQQLNARQVRAQYWFVRKDRFKRIPIVLDDEVERTYAHTLDVLVRGIAAGLFPAKAPEAADFAWVQCPYCNPDGLGHADARERWERKRLDPALADLVALIDPGAAAGDEIATIGDMAVNEP
jgi:RecB family exonuclease